MNVDRFWKPWLSAAAVLFSMSAAPALSQQAPASPNVTVYESPT